MREVFFLDIDTQVDFMEPRGGLYIEGATRITGNIRRLMRFALKAHIPVLSTADTHTRNDPEFRLFPRHCVKGTSGHRKINGTVMPHAALYRVGAGLDPAPSVAFACHPQVIVEKPKLDMFSSPHTARLLSALPREAVVFGVAGDGNTIQIFCRKATGALTARPRWAHWWA